MESITYLGTTDDITSCDCCGREDLKSTVALDLDGATVHYGVTCAANALRLPVATVRQGTKRADAAAADSLRSAQAKVAAAEFARWVSFCRENGTGPDLFTQIQSLGGYAAAKALYNAPSARD